MESDMNTSVIMFLEKGYVPLAEAFMDSAGNSISIELLVSVGDDALDLNNIKAIALDSVTEMEAPRLHTYLFSPR